MTNRRGGERRQLGRRVISGEDGRVAAVSRRYGPGEREEAQGYGVHRVGGRRVRRRESSHEQSGEEKFTREVRGRDFDSSVHGREIWGENSRFTIQGWIVQCGQFAAFC